MVCITNEGLALLRTDDTFNSWLLKIKNEYPDKSDEEIENTLISFMELNNGNFPGYTPFGDNENPQKSETFNNLVGAYDGDEVRAMEVYELLFSDDFIKEFGNWCNAFVDTTGLTEELVLLLQEEDKEKLKKSIRNTLGEPKVLFINSINHLSRHEAISAVSNKDMSSPFKIRIENGEVYINTGYDRSVQSGSITFVVAKNTTVPVRPGVNIQIDVDDVYKAYDFNSGNKGFTEKRLTVFLSQSSKDVYFTSKKISEINGLLVGVSSQMNRLEVIEYIRNSKVGQSLIFDTDELSPFGCIQLMQTKVPDIKLPWNDTLGWLIVSPAGIFCAQNRYRLGSNGTMILKVYSAVNKLADVSFINQTRYKSIKDYIISNVATKKSDSYLTLPMLDYEGTQFVLKPATNRTLHNIKTELAMTYAVMLYKKDLKKFEKYLIWAKLFPEIRQNSVGDGFIKDANMVGNLIGSILSGLIMDSNYYTAHEFDRSTIDQAIFVSKHQTAIREIVKDIQIDLIDIYKNDKKMDFIKDVVDEISKIYNKTDFSDVADNISKNRTISKIDEYAISHSFCDTIDKVKAAYNYRRNDSGSKKSYDATEYTKLSSTYEQLNALNKDIKEYLIKGHGEDTISGDSLERLISKYFTCITTIISIMDDDINRLEDFIWNIDSEKMYTPEYYSDLLYFDRSIIKMYKKQKLITEELFKLDSDNSDIIQKSLYDLFSQKLITAFEKLRDRYYKNYDKISTKRTYNNKKGSLESIIGTMIEDAISRIVDEWCDKNLKCLSESEERNYRENLKLDLEGHINAGYPWDTAIGAASASSHNIINVLYRIIQTQGKRSNLLIKAKGDALIKQFKSVFGTNVNPFNQCKQFCEMIDGKTTGYFIRSVNYGLYYRAKVAEQRRLLDKLPKNDKGQPLYYTIDESKSTATKLFIEWGVGSEKYQNEFLNDMDLWIEANANRRYNAQYYIKRREILGKERNGIIVGNEAVNRLNTLRRQIDGIKNRYRDKKTKVFLPFKVPPVLRKILQNLELQLLDLSSVYEKYVNPDGTYGIREKTGLDLAVALNIQEWNAYIQDKRKYSLDTERYNKVRKGLEKQVGKGITKEDLEAFDEYYHKSQAKLEYYDALEEKYGGYDNEYLKDIDDIRRRRRSVLSRVKHGKRGLLQLPNLDELTDAEWEVLKDLDVREREIRDKLPLLFNTVDPITGRLAVINQKTGKSFVEEHTADGRLHTYTDDNGITHRLSVYYISVPTDNSLIEDVLTDEFSIEESEYANTDFDPENTSYEQPLKYDRKTGEKLYKNDEYEKISKNEKLFGLYETFLEIMQEANQMFGYAAISSNYKLPQIYERAASVYIGRGCGIANAFVYDMKRSFLIDERDLDRSYTSDIHADNTSSGKLRKRFVEMLSDPEHISTDLVYSAMAYYMTACRYSDKQDVQALCELINRKIQSLQNTSDGLKTQANATVETFLFENTINSNSSVVAIVERFMEHTTAVMLKWKLKSAIKALIDGYRLLTNVMASNKWNIRGHFLDSTKKALMLTFTSIRSATDVLDYNLSEALMSLNGLNFSSFLDTNKTVFTRAYLKSGMMPALTMIDHVTTKSIMLAVYDSIRLYTNPDDTKQFLNIDEFINMYKKHHPELDEKVAEDEADRLFWGKDGGKVVTLYDAYLLGKRDKKGKIIPGTENILSIKDEYLNMFSSDEKENQDQWDILSTRVIGQLDVMAAAINGFKPEDSKSGTFMTRWYLKPIFQIRSFLISNVNELFKYSDTLKYMRPDSITRSTSDYKPESPYKSSNPKVQAIDKFWSKNSGMRQMINRLTSEREMYNVLTGTKDVGYYFGVMSLLRKLIENFIIYAGSIRREKNPDDYRHISKLEKISVINMAVVMLEGGIFYNGAVFIGGLLTCLLSQGGDPDDEDEYFVHWFLWLMYDICGSMFNDTFISIPSLDPIADLFRNIMAMVPAWDSFKRSLGHIDDAMSFVKALLFGDEEAFEDPDYGTNSSPFNLIKSGKWQREMYGKRFLYESVQNFTPAFAIANLKESFSAAASKAKASYTFNNLSPMDYFNLGTPSSSDASYEKFHNYGPTSLGAKMLNSLIGGPEGEEEKIDFIRNLSTSPNSPIPTESPVDKFERLFPFGRQYDR